MNAEVKYLEKEKKNVFIYDISVCCRAKQNV